MSNEGDERGGDSETSKTFPNVFFRSYATPLTGSPPATPLAKSDTEDDFESEITTDVDSRQGTSISTSTQPSKRKGPSNFELESSHYMGIDAVKKLRMHYNVNKVLLSWKSCD